MLEDFGNNIKSYFPMIFKSGMMVSIVYAVSCLLMMIGSLSHKIRYLMMPYLINQLVLVITLITASGFFNMTIMVLGFHSYPLSLIVILILWCVLYYGWFTWILSAPSDKGTCESNFQIFKIQLSL